MNRSKGKSFATPHRKVHTKNVPNKKTVKKPLQKPSSSFKPSRPLRAMKFDATQGLTEEQLMYQETAQQFADSELAPNASKWDEAKAFDRDVIKKAAELGFLGLYLGQDVGGLGLSRKDSALIYEALATGDVSTAAYMSIHQMAANVVDSYGTPEQRQKWVPDMITYNKAASYALTEPGAGSDAGHIATKAEKRGAAYYLTGSKCFITGGGYSDVYVVMARTSDNGAKGISTFIVPADTPGMSFGANERKMGWHSSPTAMVHFDNVEVPAENLVGNVEGMGFKWAMSALDGGRINIAAMSLGGARKSFDLAANYVQERKQFGQSIANNQWVQFTLADMATKLTASRLFMLDAGNSFDQNTADKTMKIAMAKTFITEECSHIADQALQLHGGYGYLRDFPLEKNVRDLRVNQILEGTNQIMRVITSRHILKE